MKVYNAIIHGINIPFDQTDTLYGFFKPVYVLAFSPFAAEEKAKRKIRNEIKGLRLFCELSVDRITEVDFFPYFTLFTDYGYYCYPMKKFRKIHEIAPSRINGRLG